MLTFISQHPDFLKKIINAVFYFLLCTRGLSLIDCTHANICVLGEIQAWAQRFDSVSVRSITLKNSTVAPSSIHSLQLHDVA